MLLSGRPPWDDSHFGKLCETVLSGAYSFPLERWDGVSNSAKMLCSRLLTVDPMKRITVEEALKHDWVCKKNKKISFWCSEFFFLRFWELCMMMKPL